MDEFKLTTPVAFIIFNRPDTSVQVFEEIRKAKPEKLYIISDAAREGREEEAEKVKECRKSIEDMIDWSCEVHKNYAESNMGCKMRVSSGISWALENEDRIIILEDDVVPSQQFFPYMQQMLEEYKNKKHVMMVSGTNLMKGVPVEGDYTFSFFAMIWGWGTWKRAWSEHYDVTMADWPEVEKSGQLKKIYGNPLSYWLFKRDAYKVYSGEKDTWDIQWDYCRFKNKALGIVPKYNMINNIGFEREDATHTTGVSFEDFSYGNMNIPCTIKDRVEYDRAYDKAWIRKYMGVKRIAKAVIRKIKV